MPSDLMNIFYHARYLEIQDHKHLKVFENKVFRFYTSLDDGTATSLPRGLFGSFEQIDEVSERDFTDFISTLKEELIEEGIKELILVHPPPTYKGFVPTEWLQRAGFAKNGSEISHHIDLRHLKVHQMERRKLSKLKEGDLNVREVSPERLKLAYDFLVACRKDVGLDLNISFEKLQSLFKVFPDRYSIFFATLKDELASVVITVQTARDVVYYYLPGTNSNFKKDSPMVGLIHHLVDHYKDKMKYLDLGVSSMNGEPQNGLITFKERMGGIRLEKPNFSLNLAQLPAR